MYGAALACADGHRAVATRDARISLGTPVFSADAAHGGGGGGGETRLVGYGVAIDLAAPGVASVDGEALTVVVETPRPSPADRWRRPLGCDDLPPGRDSRAAHCPVPRRHHVLRRPAGAGHGIGECRGVCGVECKPYRHWAPPSGCRACAHPRTLCGASYVAVTILLALVRGTACYVPASRAARADPLRVLRSD